MDGSGLEAKLAKILFAVAGLCLLALFLAGPAGDMMSALRHGRSRLREEALQEAHAGAMAAAAACLSDAAAYPSAYDMVEAVEASHFEVSGEDVLRVCFELRDGFSSFSPAEKCVRCRRLCRDVKGITDRAFLTSGFRTYDALASTGMTEADHEKEKSLAVYLFGGRREEVEIGYQFEFHAPDERYSISATDEVRWCADGTGLVSRPVMLFRITGADGMAAEYAYVTVNNILRSFGPYKPPRKDQRGSAPAGRSSGDPPSRRKRNYRGSGSLDPYDANEYDDPDDFAYDWAEDFSGGGEWSDGYDDALDHWEENH